MKVQLRKKLSVRLVCHHKPDSTNILQLEIKGKQGKERKCFAKNFYTKNIQRVGREWMKMDLQQFSFTIGVISNKSTKGFSHLDFRGK